MALASKSGADGLMWKRKLIPWGRSPLSPLGAGRLQGSLFKESFVFSWTAQVSALSPATP